MSAYRLLLQGSKLAVANVQSATDLRLFAPKIFDLGATLPLKFLKLNLAWSSKSLILLVCIAFSLCLKGFSLDARRNKGKLYGTVGLMTEC